MTTKHTPGPWDYEKENNGKPTDRFFIYSEPLQTEQQFDEAEIASGIIEEANARLIAAAPELLEALKAIKEACELNGKKDNAICHPDGWGAAHRKIGAFVGAAIAKAEGR